LTLDISGSSMSSRGIGRTGPELLAVIIDLTRPRQANRSGNPMRRDVIRVDVCEEVSNASVGQLGDHRADSLDSEAESLMTHSNQPRNVRCVIANGCLNKAHRRGRVTSAGDPIEPLFSVAACAGDLRSIPRDEHIDSGWLTAGELVQDRVRKHGHHLISVSDSEWF
jgi:hypothetical protein